MTLRKSVRRTGFCSIAPIVSGERTARPSMAERCHEGIDNGADRLCFCDTIGVLTPEKTREVLTEDGWFKTGDLGVFDKNGWLSHKGRLKNMIVGANGENIYPEEIESLINNFKHVAESIVIQKKGQLVAMVHFNREELEQKVREMKADFAIKVDEKIEEISQMVDATINDLASELKHYINTRVSKSSRIQALIIQTAPFEKTATLKIKRYLYAAN